MAISTVANHLGLLNEVGLNVVEVKRVLLENKHNPLLFNSISSSLNEKDFDGKIYEALFNEKVSVDKFEELLITDSKYSNKEVMKKHYEDFRKKLSNFLERKGQKHFSTDLSLSKGGVLLVKKIGINLDFIRREFLVTEREAKKLQKNGFVEAYAKLKVNAIVKHMIERAEKVCGKSSSVKLELSDFYHDEQSNYFNVDFVAVIPLTEKQLSSPTTALNDCGKYLNDVLAVVEKEYYKTFNS